MHMFSGYVRPVGPAGIRNAVLIISGDLCCNPWSRDIAAPFDNCYALTHKHGVGNYAPDRALFKRIIAGITVNPNVYGFVFVSSGNEDHAPDELCEAASAAGKPYYIVSARSYRSGADVVAKGAVHAGQLVSEASMAVRVPMDISDLRIGLNCAGTDTVSGETVHPLLGAVSDRLVSLGATVVLSETPDLIGLDDILYDRCERPADRQRLMACCEASRALLAATGEKIDDIEMVAFNVEGGLTSLRHKAGVSVAKAGNSPIAEVVDYGASSERRGLVFMDGPAMTDFVMTGYMSAGVHLMINTCGAGEGNKMPFTVGADAPSPILPVLKMTGSSDHFAEPSNRIDFDAAPVHRGDETHDQAAKRLLKAVLDMASGSPGATEHPLECALNIPVLFHQA